MSAAKRGVDMSGASIMTGNATKKPSTAEIAETLIVWNAAAWIFLDQASLVRERDLQSLIFLGDLGGESPSSGVNSVTPPMVQPGLGPIPNRI
jgi:hypothetical protein